MRAHAAPAGVRQLREGHQGRTFREDRFYRLAVITLEVPPPRNRPATSPSSPSPRTRPCAERGRLELTDAAVTYLAAQPWPGNVRELEDTIERAVILAIGNVLDVAVRRPTASTLPLQTFTGDHIPSLDELERAHILRVLEICEGQKTKAAALLRINRTTLWKKLRQYGIEGD